MAVLVGDQDFAAVAIFLPAPERQVAQPVDPTAEVVAALSEDESVVEGAGLRCQSSLAPTVFASVVGDDCNGIAVDVALFEWRHGSLTLKEWWRSIRGPKAYALFSWSDPVPFISDIVEVIRLLLSPQERKKRGL